MKQLSKSEIHDLEIEHRKKLNEEATKREEKQRQVAHLAYLRQLHEEEEARKRELKKIENAGLDLIAIIKNMVQCPEVWGHFHRFKTAECGKHPLILQLINRGRPKNPKTFTVDGGLLEFEPKSGYSLPDWAYGMAELEKLRDCANELNSIQKLQYIDRMDCRDCAFWHGEFERNIKCGFASTNARE